MSAVFWACVDTKDPSRQNALGFADTMGGTFAGASMLGACFILLAVMTRREKQSLQPKVRGLRLTDPDVGCNRPKLLLLPGSDRWCTACRPEAGRFVLSDRSWPVAAEERTAGAFIQKTILACETTPDTPKRNDGPNRRLPGFPA